MENTNNIYCCHCGKTIGRTHLTINEIYEQIIIGHKATLCDSINCTLKYPTPQKNGLTAYQKALKTSWMKYYENGDRIISSH